MTGWLRAAVHQTCRGSLRVHPGIQRHKGEKSDTGNNVRRCIYLSNCRLQNQANGRKTNNNKKVQAASKIFQRTSSGVCPIQVNFPGEDCIPALDLYESRVHAALS